MFSKALQLALAGIGLSLLSATALVPGATRVSPAGAPLGRSAVIAASGPSIRPAPPFGGAGPASPTAVRRFDMGQPSSPLASGYVLIDPTTAYEASVGHGWTSSPELAYLRPPPDWKVPHNLPEALIRDGVQSVGDITFRVDLPKGTYHVKAVLGDLGSTSGMLLKTPRERMDVFAGGIPVVTDAFARTMTDKGSLDYSIGGYKQVRFLSEVTGGGARDPVSL